MSIHVRRQIESIFGWMKTVGGIRKTRFRGLVRASLHFSLVATAYNLVRMAGLARASTEQIFRRIGKDSKFLQIFSAGYKRSGKD